MKSLEKQLAYALTLSLTAIFVVFWWVMTYTIHELTERYILTRLEHDAETLLKHLRVQDGRWFIAENAAEIIYQRPKSGHYYVVKSQPPSRLPEIRSSSLLDYDLYAPVSGKVDAVYETYAPESLETLVLRVPFERNDHKGVLFVAEDHSPIQASLRQFDLIFALFSLFGMGLLLWTQRHLLKKGFATLVPVQKALDDVQAGKEVSIQTQVPDEIVPLVDTLNQSLAQLHARLERSRQATGNLAHALKSPLNLIYQLLDSAELEGCPERKRQLQEQAQRISDLIERELSQARTAGHGMALQAFQLPDDLNDLIQTMQQLYRDKGVAFECHGDLDEPLPFDKEDLFELLGNLLDNAAKWCQSRVRITIRKTPHGWLFEIEDDGPGVSADEKMAMQKRGTRLDESQPGHGLGLSIVYQIVEAYGGELNSSGAKESWEGRAPLSGLQVSVYLSSERHQSKI